MIETEIKIERNVLKELGEKKFIPALKRAQAYLRGAAKRKIRRRKKGHSKPGQPPFAHSKTFKQSIQFQVNKKDLEQYVGPERIIAYSLNPDKKPVPATLEKGGIVQTSSRNGLYNTQKYSSAGEYFRKSGFVPVRYRKSAGGNMSKFYRKVFSPKLNRNIYVLWVPLRSEKQLRRGEEIQETLFGRKHAGTVKQAPRPYMVPALTQTQQKIRSFFTK